ncbi:MAG TPA: murein biosynthesis integral membrane protein MurJ [Candidatus Binatia bacterium]|nr:murein biosynthesis integral membrane protein MurJ [Candidatus Binatia bacterium]
MKQAKSTRAKITAAAFLLMALGSLEQLTGLLKQVLTAALFGTSESMDSFLIAIAIFGIIRAWISHPIDQTIIPMFRHDLAKQGEKESWANVSVLFNNLALVLTVLALIAWLVAPYLVRMIAPGFDAESGGLASSLTRITMAGVLFMGLERILSQILFSYERFALPGVAGSVENFVEALVLLVFAGMYGIYGMAIAVVAGAIARFVLQLPILWEKRRFYAPKVNLFHPRMTELGRLSFPLMLASSGDQLARVTDRLFASLLPGGSLSALNFAHGLITALNTFFIGSFQQSTFPHFSKLSAEENFGALSRQLFHYLRVVFFLTVPMAVGIMVVAESAVALVYQRGAFDEESVRLTSQALIFYAIGFPASSLARVLNRTFFTLKNTKTPSKLAVLRIAIKIVLSGLLIRPLGHVGIAIAESLSHIIRIVFLFLLLPNEVKGNETWNTIKSLGQTLASACVMGGLVYLIQERLTHLFDIPMATKLAVLVILGCLFYGIAALASQQQELRSVFESLRSLTARFRQPKSARLKSASQ